MSTQTITTSVLGKTKMSGASFENPDGSPLKIDTDYFGGIRPSKSPFVGPFKELKLGEQTIRVW
jgi:hypothetical protein